MRSREIEEKLDLLRKKEVKEKPKEEKESGYEERDELGQYYHQNHVDGKRLDDD